MRTCVGCRTVAGQASLRRYALAGDRVIADAKRTRPGRGAYVCSPACAREAARRGGFSRAFRTRVEVAPDHLEWTD